MSKFMEKLNEMAIDPAERICRTFTTVGKVIKSNEKNNTCSVEYIDKDGYSGNKDNVPVKLNSTCVIDWFPDVGDYVNIEEDESTVTITSKYEGDYKTNTRASLKQEDNIYASNFTCLPGGFTY